MDRQTLIHWAVEAEQRVALGQRHIELQAGIVDHLTRHGYPSQLALDLLQSYQASQAAHIRHRDRLRAQLANASDDAEKRGALAGRRRGSFRRA